MTVTTQPTVVRGLGDPGRYLLPEEIVVVGVRRHLLVLGAALLETLGFIAAALMLQYLFEYTPLIDRVCAVIILLAVVRFIYLVIEWRMERFVISNQRMLLISGVITRRIAAVPLRKVTDLTFEKPLIGQIVGYGTFIIESAGQDQAMSHVTFLPHADRLYLKVSDLLFGTGVPQVDRDLVVDPPPEGRSWRSERGSERGSERDTDRRDTDPALGQQLAGLDFDAPLPPEHQDPTDGQLTEPVPTDDWAPVPVHRDDSEGDRLPSDGPAFQMPGLHDRPRSGTADRLLNGLGGLHGRGVRRDPGEGALREARPPRWARRD